MYWVRMSSPHATETNKIEPRVLDVIKIFLLHREALITLVWRVKHVAHTYAAPRSERLEAACILSSGKPSRKTAEKSSTAEGEHFMLASNI
jgi:hypothetical protein